MFELLKIHIYGEKVGKKIQKFGSRKKNYFFQ